MNKIRLHFTWGNGIEADPSLYLINIDLLREDDSLSDKGNLIRLKLLNAIYSGKDFVESLVQNQIYEAEESGDFDLSKYVLDDGIRTLTIASWQQP